MKREREIPFFDYPALFAKQEPELMALMRDVLRRGTYIMQKDLAAFELNLSRYLRVKHAIGVSDGTVALILALKAAGLKPGQTIVTASHTFVATAAAIHHAGGKPLLVECGADHLLDADAARRAIRGDTWGIMPVQLNGRTANMEALLSLASERGLVIVEDACQALGSIFKGRYAGTFGIAGAFSFYPSKTLGCFGDGGAVVTDNDEVAERVRLLRDHGRAANGEVMGYGYNSRLDNLHAAVLNFKLKHYDREIARRRELARRYHDSLHDLPELLLPPAPDSDPDRFDVFQNFEVEAESRDELRRYLDQRGVKTILQWGGKMVHQFKALGLGCSLPHTDIVSQRYLLLPLHTALQDEDIDYICSLIREFYGKS